VVICADPNLLRMQLLPLCSIHTERSARLIERSLPHCAIEHPRTCVISGGIRVRDRPRRSRATSESAERNNHKRAQAKKRESANVYFALLHSTNSGRKHGLVRFSCAIVERGPCPEYVIVSAGSVSK